MVPMNTNYRTIQSAPTARGYSIAIIYYPAALLYAVVRVAPSGGFITIDQYPLESAARNRANLEWRADRAAA